MKNSKRIVKCLAGLVGMLMVPGTFSSAFSRISIDDQRKLTSHAASLYERVSSHVENSSKLLQVLGMTFTRGIETERLIIDGIKEGDIESLTKKICDEDVTKYYIGDEDGIEEGFKFSNEFEAKYHVSTCQRFHNICYALRGCNSNPLDRILGERDFAIRLKDTGEAIGILGYNITRKGLNIKLDINYFIGKDFQGKGYTKEAATALTKLIFNNLNEGTFVASLHQDNAASERLAKSLMNSIKEDKSATYEREIEFFGNMVDFTLRKSKSLINRAEDNKSAKCNRESEHSYPMVEFAQRETKSTDINPNFRSH